MCRAWLRVRLPRWETRWMVRPPEESVLDRRLCRSALVTRSVQGSVTVASSGEERAYECAELVGPLHDLGVSRGGQNCQPAVRKEVEHLGCVVEADEVAVAYHEERGGGDRADLFSGP